MEQLSLNDVLFDAIYEKADINTEYGVYSSIAADIAEKFVREIAQEFAMYCMDELGYDQSTIIDEQFKAFLKQKYGKAYRKCVKLNKTY